MNLFDFFLLAILFGAGVLGYKKGIILQIASLCSTIVSLIMAFIFTDELAQKLFDLFSSDPMETWVDASVGSRFIYAIIAFLLILAVVKVIFALFTSIFHRLAEFSILRHFNRAGGVLFALLQTLIVYVILVNLLQVMPWEFSQMLIDGSLVSDILIGITPDLTQFLLHLFLGTEGS